MEYTANLSEPWFTLCTTGIKNIEGRLNNNKFKDINEGDILILNNADDNWRFKIRRTHIYKSFREMLENENMSRVLPHINNIEDGVSIYHQFYSVEDEQRYGVKIFELV